MIDKLQNYYGIAIRANVGNLAEIKKAVLASFFHCASSKSRPLHHYCPVCPDSWCGYQLDKKITNMALELLLKFQSKSIKPIYQRLSDEGLLEKCLHGKTQNQNECFNGLVWQRVQKRFLLGKILLSLVFMMLLPTLTMVPKLF